MKLTDLCWAEKYRPVSVNNVISKHTDKILNYLKNPSAIPNFLFYSKIGGTGKTSMARCIIKDLKCDFLSINASADRSIDNIRTRVRDFARSQSTNNSRKCIFMDEGEKLTKDSMDALKNMIEEFSSNCFFIFTTNNVEKINQPMQSRFICLEFTHPDKSDIERFLTTICTSEGLVYNVDGVKKLIEMYYPSIRNMVNYLQDLKNSNEQVFVENIINNDETFEKLWALIVNKNYESLKKQIIECDVDVEEFNKFIFRLCLSDKIEERKQVKILQTLSKNEVAFSTTADKLIVFLASSIELMLIMKREE